LCSGGHKQEQTQSSCDAAYLRRKQKKANCAAKKINLSRMATQEGKTMTLL